MGTLEYIFSAFTFICLADFCHEFYSYRKGGAKQIFISTSVFHVGAIFLAYFMLVDRGVPSGGMGRMLPLVWLGYICYKWFCLTRNAINKRRRKTKES